MTKSVAERITAEAERITALEVQMSYLMEMMAKQNEKLDELLGLKNRGVGAFWLASALAGTGIIGVLVSVVEWIKG